MSAGCSHSEICKYEITVVEGVIGSDAEAAIRQKDQI